MKIKEFIENLYDHIEDIIYYLIALVLVITSALIFYDIIINLLHFSTSDNFTHWLVGILDKSLLVLMIGEILYTIRVTIKERSLCADPFFIVGLIAAIRRILVISVETAYYEEKFKHFMIEISILGALVFIFTFAMIMLRKNRQLNNLKE